MAHKGVTCLQSHAPAYDSLILITKYSFRAGWTEDSLQYKHRTGLKFMHLESEPGILVALSSHPNIQTV